MKVPTVRPMAFTYSKPSRGIAALQCDKVALSRLARDFGTPLYCYSATGVRVRHGTFARAFAGVAHTICYSVKANSNLAILKLLAKLGCGFDVVSGGELQRVLQLGKRAAKEVVFSGVGKTDAEMKLALDAGIGLFNVESEGELEHLASCAAHLKKRAAIALRVNPDVKAETHPYISTGMREHKFGVPVADAERLYGKAAGSRWLEVTGVSVHIGSQIMMEAPFREAMQRVATLVRQLRAAGHQIRFVDAGGGLGISYESAEDDSDFRARAEAYAKAVTTPLRNLGVHLLLEPGRALIAPAGALMTRVVYVKRNGGKRFAVVDAAMNDLIRPSLYGAYHTIVPVEWREDCGLDNFDVVGPICETGDFFARDRQLPEPQEGDLLAVLDAGAYGMSLASNYNSRPRAAEVLVDGSRVRLIRSREKISDLWRDEKS